MADLYEELISRMNKRSSYRFNQWLKSKNNLDMIEVLIKLEENQLKSFLKKAKKDHIASLLEKANEKFQLKIVDNLEIQEIVKIFSYVSKDELVDIIGYLSINKQRKILNKMSKKDEKIIRSLLKYDEETAGGLMTTEYLAFEENLTVQEVLSRLEDQVNINTAEVETLFVVNKQGQLLGKTDLRYLFTASENQLLKEIAKSDIVQVTTEIDQEEVSHLATKYELKVVPVVDQDNKLQGIITIDDMIEVMKEEATEDVLMMVGVDKEERANSSWVSSMKKRLPWLFVNLATAFLAASVVGVFEDVIAQVVALAVAMPIVAGMGGNAGSQTLSIMIREFALGELNFKNDWKILFKEILLGIIHGSAIGILTGLILYLNYGNIYLGAIIFLSMIANLVIAGISGFLIPVTLKALGIDPALASAIFLTTATDVFGFFVFLGLAKMFLEFL